MLRVEVERSERLRFNRSMKSCQSLVVTSLTSLVPKWRTNPQSSLSRNSLAALSRLLVCCAKMHGVAMFHATAVMASHLSIAAARDCRIVLREIR